MSDVYDEILNQSNIQTVLEHYGLKIVKNKCQCPFHADTHPSMSIHRNKGIAKCFACGAGGNTISFIQKYENEINHRDFSVKDAMQKAIDIQGLNIQIPQNSNNIELTKEQKEQKKLRNILLDAINICENNLKVNNIDCKNALKYLENRNLSNKIINDFHIGFNVASDNITDKLLTKYSLQDLIKVGIVKEQENDYKDIFSQRIIIPIFDENGYPVGFGARVLNNKTKPKYINTNSTPLFNKSNLLFNYHQAKYVARNNEMIIVEGYMDVISSKAIGFDNVVGTMGTAITDEHIKLLKKLKCEVTLSLDNDNAGKDAMLRIIPELLKHNIKVNVLDIAKLGEYKDFGDLQMANIPREKIYQTKISAFTFLMQEKYMKNVELSVENINRIFHKMLKDKLINNSKDTLEFKEVIVKNTNYTNDEIEQIINPSKIKKESAIDKYKNVFFYNYILNLIKQYAEKHQDIILSKFVGNNLLDMDTLTDTLNNDKYLAKEGLSIYIGNYIKEVIYNMEEYKKLKNDKMFILDKLLNNVKSFDANGNIVNLELTMEQKQMVIDQYNSSFDESIKHKIESEADTFDELFIANSSNQFETLFPKSYVEQMKEQAINRFKNENVMEAVRYALAYTEDMKSVVSDKYVANGKYKTLLVFDNNKNILSLSTDNIKLPQKEETKEKNVEKNKSKEKKSMSFLIKLTGNEKETCRGLYLPIHDDIEVYIPKELYKKNGNKIEIINNNSSKAVMSEYKMNPNERTKDKWLSQLTLQDFYKKYLGRFEIQMEREVMA